MHCSGFPTGKGKVEQDDGDVAAGTRSKTNKEMMAEIKEQLDNWEEKLKDKEKRKKGKGEELKEGEKEGKKKKKEKNDKKQDEKKGKKQSNDNMKGP